MSLPKAPSMKLTNRTLDHFRGFSELGHCNNTHNESAYECGQKGMPKEEARKKLSNVTIDVGGNQKKIVSWTHNGFEMDDGIKRKDEHFLNLIKDMKILSDPDGKLENLRYLK